MITHIGRYCNTFFFENGYAYATNGHIAVKQSLDDYCDVIEKEKLNGHAIYKTAFAQILKFPMAVATEEGVECILHWRVD